MSELPVFANELEALATKDRWLAAYEKLNDAGREALGEIVAGMGHRLPSVRRFCTALMDHHADQSCVPALLRALEDEDSNVRRLAVHAIGCQRCKCEPLGIDAVALLIERLERDTSIRVRQAAAHMFGNQMETSGVVDPRAVVALEKTLKTEANEKLRSNARWALRQLRGA